jgi:hypothetical protein
MKRTFALILAAVVAVAVFAGLVYFVLVAAHVSGPAATTVHGLTPGRLWATTAAVLALVGVVIDGLALRRSTGRIGTGNGRMGAIMALVTGLIAMALGGLARARSRRTGYPGHGAVSNDGPIAQPQAKPSLNRQLF